MVAPAGAEVFRGDRMKRKSLTPSRQAAKTPFAPLRLCVMSLLFAGFALAGDVGRADKLLVQAAALIEAARAELASANPPDDPPEYSAIGLESFAWAGRKSADPAGLPAGAKYGEGVENGKRTCQWHYGDWILHAVFSASAKTANGSTVRWYHFTTNGQPSPLLSAYKWKHTHTASEGGVTWYRYAGG